MNVPGVIDQMSKDPKSSRVQSEIDANLKRAYDDVLKQEIPDRFTDLLAKLKSAEAEKTGKSRGEDVDK